MCEMRERRQIVQIDAFLAVLRAGIGVFAKVAYRPCAKNGSKARRSKGMPWVR